MLTNEEREQLLRDVELIKRLAKCAQSFPSRAEFSRASLRLAEFAREQLDDTDELLVRKVHESSKSC